MLVPIAYLAAAAAGPALIGPPAPTPPPKEEATKPAGSDAQAQAQQPAPTAAAPPSYRLRDGAYAGQDREYHQDCRRSNGTTGTLAGAGGGGLIAGAATGSPFMAAWGAVAGGLLGRRLDKRHDAAQNARNGCPDPAS